MVILEHCRRKIESDTDKVGFSYKKCIENSKGNLIPTACNNYD